MTRISRLITLVTLSTIFALTIIFSSFTMNHKFSDKDLKGAWMKRAGDVEEVLVYMDNYFTHTAYNIVEKKFLSTRGGTGSIKENKFEIEFEFDTEEKDNIGQLKTFPFSLKQEELSVAFGKGMEKFKRIDNGAAPLAGVWQITSRMQDEKLVPIHRTGTRKTLKILSGSRFQWAAIDPGTKQFSGTGGGTYSFIDGKYSEQIEFFSRDSSRVGAVLIFDGKLVNGEWHHSGKSSKGDPIYEVWSKTK